MKWSIGKARGNSSHKRRERAKKPERMKMPLPVKPRAKVPKPPQFRKLVRDKVPDIIEKSGRTPVTRVAGQGEFTGALKEKILEEARELVNAASEEEELEEIIDIMEAVNAYMKQKDVPVGRAEMMRKHKLRKRGGFEKAIILEGIE